MSSIDSTLDSPRRSVANAWWMVIAAGAGVAVSLSPGAPFITACLFAVSLSICATLLLPAGDRVSVLAAFLVALVLRLGSMFIIHAWVATPNNPNGFLYPDSYGYHRIGITVAGIIHADLAFRLAYHTPGSHLGYHQVIGFLYAAFGVSHWIGKTVNCLLGAGSILLTYCFARPLVGRRAAIISAWMLALWPTAIFWSAQLLKDTLIAFMFILAAGCWVGFLVSRRWMYLLLYVLATGLLLPMRIYTSVFLALGLYVGLLVFALMRKRYLLAGGLVLGAILACCSIPFDAVLFQGSHTLFTVSRGTHYSQGSTLTAIAQRGVSHWILVPLALVKFMISPLPWNASGVDLLIVPGIIMQYVILPFAARGAIILLRHGFVFVLPVVVVSVLSNILYAFVFLGGIPRHMNMFYPFMFVCAAIGLQSWRNWVLPWCGFLVIFTLGALAVLVMRTLLR
jgi:uncharacterized membrane protein